MTTKLAALALAATLLPVTASANVVAIGAYRPAPAEDASAPEPASPRRIEGRLGMVLGSSDVGDADGFSRGVSGSIGYRIGDVTLRGILDYYRVGDGDDETMRRRGNATRVGAALRYSLLNGGDTREDLSGDFWGEVGLGYEHVAWRAGGVLDRPSGQLAVGLELDGIKQTSGRPRHMGFYVAFRTLLAQGPEMDGPTACGGPCSKATKPSRLDTTMFFEFGLHWGR